MRLSSIILCAVSVVAATSFAGAAGAGDLGSANGAQPPLKLDQQIDQAAGSAAGASDTDIDARVRDLESTRTEIDQKKPPAVSLSVSGWVTQQYNIKQ
jgi:hypothetical protein